MTIPIIKPPNPQAVELAEQFLKAVRSGEIQSVALAGTKANGDVSIVFAGADVPLIGACHVLLTQVQDGVLARNRN